MNFFKAFLTCTIAMVVANAYCMKQDEPQKELSSQLRGVEIPNGRAFFHREKLYRLALNPSGTKLAAVSCKQKEIDIVDIQADKHEDTLKISHAGIDSLAFNKNDQLAIGAISGQIQVWKKQDDKYNRIHNFGEPNKLVFELAYLSEDRLAIARIDFIEIWNITENKHDDECRMKDHHRVPAALVFSGNKFAISYSVSRANPEIVEIWDLARKQCISSREKYYNNKRDDAICTSLSFSSDDRTLAIGKKKVIKLLDLRSNQKVGKFDGHDDYVRALLFQDDDSHLLSASSDGTIKEWDMRMYNQAKQ